MPTKSKTQLPTSAELRILNSLWQLKEATVDEIVTSFPARKRPNYKTTQAFLRIMEQKGFVKHTARGRVFVFEPVINKEKVDQQSVQALLKQHFGGSAQGLLINLLESNAVPPSDLDAIEGLIQEYRKQKSQSSEG
jgi:predicted transcriptional regulator